MIVIFLLLGSNLGDRENYLKQAILLIESNIAPLKQRSAIYETQSWGKTDAPDYLNQVVSLTTALTARQVLHEILGIEIKLGRKREEKWGSRTIDIDILFYGDEVINEADLVIPHPELHKRRFTLAPLSEIVPNLIHPVLNQTIFELKTQLIDNLVVKKLYL